MNTGFTFIRGHFPLLFILLLGIALRLWAYSINAPFWVDEILTYNAVTQMDFASIFSPLTSMQILPPLFLLISKFCLNYFTHGDCIELAARIFPFCSSIFSFLIFFLVLRKLFKQNIAILFAMLLYAINFQLLFQTQNFKPYSFDALCTLLVIIFGLHFDFKRISNIRFFLFLAFMAFASVSSLPSIFVITALFISLVFKYARTDALKYVLRYFSLFYIVFSVYYLFHYFPDTNKEDMLQRWGNMPYAFVGTSITYMVDNFITNSSWFFRSISPLYILGLFILSFVLMYKKNFFLFTLLFCSIAGIYAASILHIYPFFERLLTFLIPIFIITFAYPLEASGDVRKYFKQLVAVVYILIFIPYTYRTLSYSLDPDNFIFEHTKYYVAIINKNIQKGEDVLMPVWNSFAYYHYSLRINPDLLRKAIIMPDDWSSDKLDILAKRTLTTNKSHWLILTSYANRAGLEKALKNNNRLFTTIHKGVYTELLYLPKSHE